LFGLKVANKMFSLTLLPVKGDDHQYQLELLVNKLLSLTF